jgi:hypothetical protein
VLVACLEGESVEDVRRVGFSLRRAIDKWRDLLSNTLWKKTEASAKAPT